MARIRSVHPSLFTDEAWVSCSPLARILYIGLWTDADDQGLFEWKPLQLKMRLLPGDAGDCAAMLAEIEAAGLICQFESRDRRFGAIKGFRKFQRPQKPNAVHDLPEHLRDYVGIEDEDDDPATGLRKSLCEAQGGRCFYCATEITHFSKRGTSCEIDHRVPRAKGGTDDPENLVAACRACNRGKCDRSESEWRAILVGRAAKAPVANAIPVLAPQMEDGGGRVEEMEASLPVAADAAPEVVKTEVWDSDAPFLAVWDAATPEMRKRAKSRRKVWPEWLKAKRRLSPDDLLGAMKRYVRDDPDVKRTGGPGLHLWLKDGTYENWLGATDSPASAATWRGPTAVRQAVVGARGDGFARSYLDPCDWSDDDLLLTPRTAFGEAKLRQEVGGVLSQFSIKIGTPEALAA